MNDGCAPKGIRLPVVWDQNCHSYQIFCTYV